MKFFLRFACVSLISLSIFLGSSTAIADTILSETVVAPKLPIECGNGKLTCTGSECPTSITSNLATQPSHACPREGENQSDADAFSWNSFIAMNWPADVSTCMPDTSKSITSGTGPVVWETFLQDTDVFVGSDQKPKEWCPQASTAPRVFKHVSKTSPNLLVELLRIDDEGFDDIDEAVGGVLTDQNGRFVRYEKRINLDEYNYITDNNLWNKKGQKAYKETIDFPYASTTYKPCKSESCGSTGSMEIKAAWKVLSKDEIKGKRFYTTQGIVYNDDHDARSPGNNPVTLGLVGFHIVHKTPENKGQQFWSTFEHVDNDPTIGHIDTKKTYSFYNPSHPKSDINKQTATKPYKELNSEGKPINAPVQVVRTREREAAEDSPGLNDYYQKLLGTSVWANYQLIGTQWPTGLVSTGVPPYLANTTLETFIQKDSSCMGCHHGAKTTAGQPADFSFLLGEAQ